MIGTKSWGAGLWGGWGGHKMVIQLVAMEESLRFGVYGVLVLS